MIQSSRPFCSINMNANRLDSNRDGNNELYVMLPNGENDIRITSNPAFDWGGCWYRLPRHPLEK